MARRKEPFAIPAICNEKEALMRYLKLASEDDEVRARVKELEQSNVPTDQSVVALRVLAFECDNVRYHVSHQSSGIEADAIVEFNASFWRIKKASASAQRIV